MALFVGLGLVAVDRFLVFLGSVCWWLPGAD